MAINPMIAMSGQPVNANAAIQGGLQTAQQIRQMPIQAALDKQRVQQGQQQLQMGQQGIQQNTNALQQTKGRYMNQLATALTKLPLEQRAGAVARALPQMQQLGISRDQALSQDLSDQALGQVIAATRPFVQTPGASSAPAGIQEFEHLTRIAGDETLPDEQRRAARIELGLSPRAVASSPKLVTIAGSQYLQVGKEFYHPRTSEKIPVDPETGLPTGDGAEVSQGTRQPEVPEAIETAPSNAGGGRQVLTPEQQTELRAESEAAVTTARETAAAQARSLSPEALRTKRKAIGIARDTLENIDSILSSDRLDDITGLSGRLPTMRPETKDLLNRFTKLSSQLTYDNLDLMSGVLSESDIRLLANISGGLGVVTDSGTGNTTRVDASLEGTVEKLQNIRSMVVEAMNQRGGFQEGQTATNPTTGERIIYQNGQWVTAR